jgi:hypothetical protein
MLSVQSVSTGSIADQKTVWKWTEYASLTVVIIAYVYPLYLPYSSIPLFTFTFIHVLITRVASEFFKHFPKTPLETASSAIHPKTQAYIQQKQNRTSRLKIT